MTNQTSENNKRIAKNSLYMSIRMIVVLFISLYTTRAILKVLGIEDYGIFIELSANLAGLAEPKEGVYVGQSASVYIKSIIPEKMKIKLIIIDSFDMPYENRCKYFYTDNHITDFIYSPPECYKKISTHF